MTEFVSKMVDSYTKPKENQEKPATSHKEKDKESHVIKETGQNGSLADALQNAKGNLKPTETVERSHPVVGTGSGSGRGSGYNIREEEEKKEFFDKEEVLTKKVKKVAEWIKSSKHVIFFTGAGISTR